VVSSPFLLGIVLDTAGFGFGFVALRRLTLFVVQAVTSASLAVTALAAVWLLGVRLRRPDVTAIAVVCGGLVLLALGAGPEGHDSVSKVFHWGVLLSAVAVIGAALLLSRVRSQRVVPLLGLLTGTSFGLVSVAVRLLDTDSFTGLATDPATYTMAVGGLGGYVCYALALQRGTVTAVTAAVIVSETVIPGVIGVVALGDRARPGFGWAAGLGFLLAVGGAFALAHFGELEEPGDTNGTDTETPEGVRPQ
jgi:drug/metabolite transporter (DMT)-like permease